MRTREQLETTAKLRALARMLDESDFVFHDTDSEWAHITASDVLDALRELESLRDEVNRLKRRPTVSFGHPPGMVQD